jgi:nitrite reductase/ring-hydroxylating ferredoxin subunit
MLLDFWYPVAFSPSAPRPASGHRARPELVVWRTRSGRIGVLSDLCVHRGGALSDGRAEGEEITCPYHGWAYRVDGSCARIPAQPQRAVPPKARVDAYPVQERYGIVWAFLGDRPEEQRPPLPEWPELDDPRWRRIQGVFRWAAAVDRVVEGGLDFTHGPFVHEGTFGRGLDPVVADYPVETTEWSGRAGRTPARWRGTCPRARAPSWCSAVAGSSSSRPTCPWTGPAPSPTTWSCGTSPRARSPTSRSAGPTCGCCARTGASWTPCGPSCCPSTSPTSRTCGRTPCRWPTGGVAASCWPAAGPPWATPPRRARCG